MALIIQLIMKQNGTKQSYQKYIFCIDGQCPDRKFAINYLNYHQKSHAIIDFIQLEGLLVDRVKRMDGLKNQLEQQFNLLKETVSTQLEAIEESFADLLQNLSLSDEVCAIYNEIFHSSPTKERFNVIGKRLSELIQQQPLQAEQSLTLHEDDFLNDSQYFKLIEQLLMRMAFIQQLLTDDQNRWIDLLKYNLEIDQNINFNLKRIESIYKYWSHFHFAKIPLTDQLRTKIESFVTSLSQPKTEVLFKEVARLEGHSDSAIAVAISPNQQYFASGSSDSLVFLWCAKSYDLLAQFEDHDGEVITVQFSPNSRLLASAGCEDFYIRVWDVPGKTLKCRLFGHTMYVTRLTFKGDSQFLVSGSCDQTVRIWDLQTEDEAQMYMHEKQVDGVAISSKHPKIIASSDRAGKIKLWGYDKEKELTQWQAHEDKCFSVNFSRDSQMLISCGRDQKIKVWLVKQVLKNLVPSPIKVFEGIHSDGIYTAVFTNDCKYILSTAFDSSIVLWDFEGEQVIQKIEIEEKNDYCSQACISSDMSFIVSGCDDSTVRIWKRC